MTGSDLANTTYAWSMQWWDPVEHMVWAPPASVDPGLAANTLHLVPNTAWLVYAQLATEDDAAHAEAVAAIRALIGLQYDRPGTVVHGTYRRFLEWPEPPAEPVMWEDYDPNWRQFVGTTFAVILEDFSDRLDADLVAAIEASIGLACAGEVDGRIPPSYSNPALMPRLARRLVRAADRRRDADAARGRAFAETIVADFDRFGAFDEFNSPTYYGIDLYALRLVATVRARSVFRGARRAAGARGVAERGRALQREPPQLLRPVHALVSSRRDAQHHDVLVVDLGDCGSRVRTASAARRTDRRSRPRPDGRAPVRSAHARIVRVRPGRVPRVRRNAHSYAGALASASRHRVDRARADDRRRGERDRLGRLVAVHARDRALARGRRARRALVGRRAQGARGRLGSSTRDRSPGRRTGAALPLDLDRRPEPGQHRGCRGRNAHRVRRGNRARRADEDRYRDVRDSQRIGRRRRRHHDEIEFTET